MTEQIISNLKAGKSVAIIGPSDSGKTYFVENELIPKLNSVGLSVAYFPDGNNIEDNTNTDVVIFDEAETLIDQERIEQKEGKPYSVDYLKQVGDWEDKYKLFKQPAIFIISRELEDAEYLLQNLKTINGRGCFCIIKNKI